MNKYLYHIFTLYILFFISCGTNNSISKYPIYNNQSVTIDTSTLDNLKLNSIKIIDGDTIEINLDDQTLKIRLIGIDTFEIIKSDKAYKQAYQNSFTIDEIVQKGKQSKEFLQELLKNKTEIFLEYDQEKKDDYDRILAYIWTSDTQMINMQMVCSGYATTLTISPNDKYTDKFELCLEFAKQNSLGIWKK